MLYLTCTMISNVDLAPYRISRAKDLGICELWNNSDKIEALLVMYWLCPLDDPI